MKIPEMGEKKLEMIWHLMQQKFRLKISNEIPSKFTKNGYKSDALRSKIPKIVFGDFQQFDFVVTCRRSRTINVRSKEKKLGEMFNLQIVSTFFFPANSPNSISQFLSLNAINTILNGRNVCAPMQHIEFGDID